MAINISSLGCKSHDDSGYQELTSFFGAPHTCIQGEVFGAKDRPRI